MIKILKPTMRQGGTVALAACLLALAACGSDDDDAAVSANPPAPVAATPAPAPPAPTPAPSPVEPQSAPTAQMKAVLDELAAIGARPINTLTVEQARTQPTPADAVRSVLAKRGASTAPEPVASVVDVTIPGPGGPLAARIYTPAATGPLPVALYIHGGGWVIATIDTYDASARALANAAGAIVVSIEYRKAPEAKFPAAHDDTFAAWQWLLANAAGFGGDPARAAVVGESAGGNMAASIAVRARDDGTPPPVHQVLVYPVTDVVPDKPSLIQNRDAAPLNTASLAWFYEKYLGSVSDAANPRFAVLRTPELRGVAPATVITADIDPLRSEGREYAERLGAAGVPVSYVNYPGVTHEFFGMGAVLDEARAAVAKAATDLKASFAQVAR